MTHISGAGRPPYADVPIPPWSQAIPDAPANASLVFSHEHEIAYPEYYSVEFEKGIKTELTVRERAGMARFCFGSWSEKLVPDRRSASGHKARGYVTLSRTGPILLKVGVSFVSIDNAEANLAAEIPGWDFDALEEELSFLCRAL